MSKGDQTRAEILHAALDEASQLGLEGMSIGALAKRVGMSKSGLFAHFGSKRDLQLAVIDLAAELFISTVIRPAITAPRGEPRVVALFDNWMTWTERTRVSGGDVLSSTPWEFDDRPGPVRDLLQQTLSELHHTLGKAARIAITQGHFRSDLDPEQFAFELHSVMLGTHVLDRLFRRPDAHDRATTAFQRLLADARA